MIVPAFNEMTMQAGPHPSGWLAVHTRSHFEKIVHTEFVRKRIESFLPTRTLVRRWSDRRKEIEEPLFRGYLFVRPAAEETLRVLQTTGVVRYVGPRNGPPWVVPESDMEALQRFIDEDLRMDPYPYLKAGQRVVVRSGPLKGIHGIIVRKPRFCRLVISVEMMMQAVAVEIDESTVEPL